MIFRWSGRGGYKRSYFFKFSRVGEGVFFEGRGV